MESMRSKLRHVFTCTRGRGQETKPLARQRRLPRVLTEPFRLVTSLPSVSTGEDVSKSAVDHPGADEVVIPRRFLPARVFFERLETRGEVARAANIHNEVSEACAENKNTLSLG